jgi:hypothetical protein
MITMIPDTVWFEVVRPGSGPSLLLGFDLERQTLETPVKEGRDFVVEIGGPTNEPVGFIGSNLSGASKVKECLKPSNHIRHVRETGF